MHKRILSFLLAAVLLLSLIPVFALPSQAASNMTTSERCIEILKQMEGFRPYAYYDYSHYSIGYGSSCEKDEYPNGITEEEADALLRQFLVDMEKSLNGFISRNDLRFSQNRFDAMMLFTYNVGIGWMYNEGMFRRAVLADALGNDFIYPFSLWSTAGGQTNSALVKRRLIEADMYLNGSYTNVCPSNYTYIVYDHNGGEGPARIQGYDYNLDAYVQSTPTREGFKFLGWYTAAEGGKWVTELTASHANQTLYAHWQAADAAPGTGAAASYEVPASRLASLEYYDLPEGRVISSLNQSTTVYVDADYVDAKGFKWGRIANGSWVILGNPRIGTTHEAPTEDGISVMVTGDYVNVRRGPGTQYEVVAGVQMGDRVVISRTVYVEDVLWGKCRAGWICLQYTDYAGGMEPDEEQPDIPVNPQQPQNPQKPEKPTGDPIARGTVKATSLNVRSTAGAHGTVVGSYKKGQTVEIYEKTTVSSAPWGRTELGWICLTYVDLEEIRKEPPQETTPPTVPETTEPGTTPPETTEPEVTVPETRPPMAQGCPATVISKSGLNIRSGAGTKYGVVGSYPSGASIRIQEQKIVSGVTWGRTDKGWVCMQYVRLEETQNSDQSVFGIVISIGGLNIRSGAGVSYAPVGKYPGGTRIEIFAQLMVSGQKWGRTDKGWVCMDYVRLEDSTPTEPPATTEPETTAPPTEPPRETEPEQPKAVTGTVTASGLNIRRTPATGAVVGGYKRGDKVTILEQKQVNGTTWGRTDRGWISLAYVQLDAAQEDQTIQGTEATVTADVLRIRTGPGTGNAIVGTYKRDQKVIILETRRVGTTTWGRTDLGWICMAYVK